MPSPGIRLRIDPTSLRGMKSKLKRIKLATETEYPEGAESIARLSLAKVKQRTPVDTAETVNGWFLKDERRSSVGVQKFSIQNAIARSKRGKELLFILEYGSRAHTIRARRAKVLHWERPPGVHHFRKEVFHPGTRPYGMLRTTAAEANVDARALMAAMQRRITRIWGGL